MTASRYTRARELAGLTIAQATKLLGWTDNMLLIDIESGEHIPSVGVVAKLADLYGVSAAWLRGARPVVPPAAERLIIQAMNDQRMSSRCGDDLLELFGAICTPETR